jgi:hypothetical protein
MSQPNDPEIAASTQALLPSLLKLADETADRLDYPPSNLRHEYHRHFLMLLAQASVQLYGTRPENPDWVPHTSVLFPWGAPNPDTMYTFAAVDATGTYRVSGVKGTESVASIMLRRGGPNNGNLHGATLDEIDIMALPCGTDKRFSFLLSPEKPASTNEPWFCMHPETTGIISRRITSTIDQHDGIWWIERLDRGPANCQLTAAEVQLRNRNLSLFVTKFNTFILNYILKLRKEAFNAFIGERFPDLGGMTAQMYYHGTWQISADEALIIETDLPSEVAYWNIQLLDAFYGAIDSTFHESSLNNDQASVDSDGKVRFVVSATDPGVPNWLATGGWTSGAMMHRWHSATDFPHPTVKKVSFTDVRRYLPANTPTITTDERSQKRSQRIRQYQSRRRW